MSQVRQAFNYPYFPRFFSIFSRFPLDFWPCSLDSWRPDEENGRKMVKMGKKWPKDGITALQKTALMHASAGLEGWLGQVVDSARKVLGGDGAALQPALYNGLARYQLGFELTTWPMLKSMGFADEPSYYDEMNSALPPRPGPSG